SGNKFRHQWIQTDADYGREIRTEVDEEETNIKISKLRVPTAYGMSKSDSEFTPCDDVNKHLSDELVIS
ncbi:hypothetical protein Tco_1127370, partial [Tanacetum coccineum]